MKATMESTDRVVSVAPAAGNRPAVMARAWEGVTEGGVRFVAYVTYCQVESDKDNSEFVRALAEVKVPDPWANRAIDMRHIL